jgi:acyl-CoA thioester hydrolase
MFEFVTFIRVRYAETDRMGYVYYGNYATYFEVARVETIKALGFSYRLLEDDGIMLPVLEYHSKFFKPAYYDDLLTIKTRITGFSGARIFFDYTVRNEQGETICEASTTLVFISADTKKPTPAPEALRLKLKSLE